jgi:hypothetical protein
VEVNLHSPKWLVYFLTNNIAFLLPRISLQSRRLCHTDCHFVAKLQSVGSQESHTEIFRCFCYVTARRAFQCSGQDQGPYSVSSGSNLGRDAASIWPRLPSLRIYRSFYHARYIEMLRVSLNKLTFAL